MSIAIKFVHGISCIRISQHSDDQVEVVVVVAADKAEAGHRVCCQLFVVVTELGDLPERGGPEVSNQLRFVPALASSLIKGAKSRYHRSQKKLYVRSPDLYTRMLIVEASTKCLAEGFPCK